MPRIRIMSDDEESSSRGGSPIPGPASPIQRGLFSDDDSSDDGGRGHASEAEEDRRGSYSGRPGQPDGDKNTDDEEEEERKKAEQRKKEQEKKKKPKGPVKRQMISEDMLTGKNGVSKLPEIFADFTFGGKGKEKDDLNRILAKLEHWVHLLHPKQPFDQSLQRIEFLGLKKKVVKTHMKKLRMGMINHYEDNDVIEDDGVPEIDFDAVEAEDANNEGHRLERSQAQATSSSNNQDEFPDDDELDEIMNETITNKSQPLKQRQTEVTSSTAEDNDNEFPDDDEMDEIMREVAAMESQQLEKSQIQVTSSSANPKESDEFPDDDEMNEIMNETEAIGTESQQLEKSHNQVIRSNSSAKNKNSDEFPDDDEMDEIMNEGAANESKQLEKSQTDATSSSTNNNEFPDDDKMDEDETISEAGKSQSQSV